MNKCIVLGCMGLIASMCHGSAGAWEDIEQMKRDISSYQTSGFTQEYFETIEQRIAATAGMRGANPAAREQIDNALCMLWTCENKLTTIRMIQEIRNENGKTIKSLNGLIGVIKSQFNAFTIALYGENARNDKDFTDLVLYTAFLHTNIKKYNPYYGFGSVVSSMLDLYEHTENPTIKQGIAAELKAIEHDDDIFGPYEDKIKDFSKSLRTILNKQ
ncbi:MAG: hypothetical protein LBJ13_00245 [Puniceicoccales bacterium]|jgi:hypothetical protein|nr:hypothetical protein [Puniceicoccales bacterium]